MKQHRRKTRNRKYTRVEVLTYSVDRNEQKIVIASEDILSTIAYWNWNEQLEEGEKDRWTNRQTASHAA